MPENSKTTSVKSTYKIPKISRIANFKVWISKAYFFTVLQGNSRQTVGCYKTKKVILYLAEIGN